MGFLQDNLLPFFKKSQLAFVESYKEAEDVYTFLFEKEKELTWKPGQYGLFSITHKKIKNGTRPLSVASAPSENVVRITTTIKEQPSEFKTALLELKKGMSVVMRGPVGPFYLNDQRSPSLLIAGGIGITPFRSLIKQLEAERGGDKDPISLLYLDSNESYLYKEELDAIASRIPIKITYLASRDDLHQEIDAFTSSHRNDGHYYMAGPKAMVESMSSYLQTKQVPKQRIKKDAFFGY